MSDIFPSMSNLKQKLFFVDPADIKKRKPEDIRQMLRLLGKINDYVPVVLSCNDQETTDISKILAKEGATVIDRKDLNSYAKGNKSINEIINLSYYLVHHPKFCTIALDKKDFIWITNGFTSHAKFTVAAGDHFNGSVLAGLKAGLKPAEALVLGNTATDIFVRTGESPSYDKIKYFMENYFHYVEVDDDNFTFPEIGISATIPNTNSAKPETGAKKSSKKSTK
jgi:hypothetical protein